MSVEKNSAIVTRLLEQCTACINLPRSWGWRGLFVCAYNGCREGSCTIVVYYRRRGDSNWSKTGKKEICRPGRDDRRGKSRESQWAAVCAQEGLKWSASFSPSVLLIYTRVFTVYGRRVYGYRGSEGEKGWERVFTTTVAAAALSCFSRRSNHRRRGFSPPFTAPRVYFVTARTTHPLLRGIHRSAVSPPPPRT